MAYQYTMTFLFLSSTPPPIISGNILIFATGLQTQCRRSSVTKQCLQHLQAHSLSDRKEGSSSSQLIQYVLGLSKSSSGLLWSYSSSFHINTVHTHFEHHCTLVEYPRILIISQSCTTALPIYTLPISTHIYDLPTTTARRASWMNFQLNLMERTSCFSLRPNTTRFTQL